MIVPHLPSFDTRFDEGTSAFGFFAAELDGSTSFGELDGSTSFGGPETRGGGLGLHESAISGVLIRSHIPGITYQP
jgi:hypothetical protein